MNTTRAEMMKSRKEYNLSFFQRYLTLWVGLCIVVGIALGSLFPAGAEWLNSLAIAQVNIPVAVLLFAMMYPIMVQIDFGEVVNVARAPRPVVLTLVINWAIKPFTMVFFAWLFFRVVWEPYVDPTMASEYMAGMILLGIAPCTAMVLVWSYLARTRMGLTLIMVAINSLAMLLLYAPLGNFLLGVSHMAVPFLTIFLSVMLYVGVSLVVGYISRTQLIKRKGIEWYERVFLKHMGTISTVALLLTLIFLFMLQGRVILTSPLIVGMIAVPLIIQTLVIFGIGYGAAKVLGLSYEEAAPAAMIGASNHFEVAIATAVMLFGLTSGAALSTVVGVLIEVPIMLLLVKICMSTQHWFPRKAAPSSLSATELTR